MARHLRGRLPLRVRLVAATLILVATGLVASGIAVTSMLQHRLTSRIDRVLLEEAQIWAQITLPLAPDPYPIHNPDRPPSRFYVRVISPDGQHSTTTLPYRRCPPTMMSAGTRRRCHRSADPRLYGARSRCARRMAT
ncbi:two component system response sensor kinase PhoR [Mycobacterium tuberculosis variant bovis BCG]|nr:two component system response sensor kinase PhoR [Mycobacterium tuberculosis variant bovis BCG]